MATAVRLDSIRLRLVALLLAVVLPLAALALLMSRASDRSAAERPLLAAQRALDLAVAEHHAEIGGVSDTMSALGAMPDIINATVSCAAILEGVLASQPRRFAALAVLDAAHRVRCGSLDGPALREAATLGAAAAGRPGLRLGMPVGIDPRGAIVATSFPLPSGTLSGALALGAPPAAASVHVWLLDGATPISPGQDTGNLPTPAVLAILSGWSAGVRLWPTRSGEPAAYAVREVSPGLHLLSGILIRDSLGPGGPPALPVVAIGTLLVAGFVLMMLGVERIVVLPMQRLDRAVHRWRGGAPPDADALEAMPRELRALTRSFAQATAALATREAELRSALGQQELLMQEVHHRVKNNLQIVASLLNLQASRIRQPEARAEFQSARDRVRALATLHRHLYGHGELHTINMREFLGELCVQLFQGFHEEVGERIDLAIDASELQMSSDQAVPIALIVTETVSNALKFAFPEARHGCIRVTLAAAGDRASLVIEDDGVGLRRDSDAAARAGIGLQLIRGFARQLGATLVVSEESGTRYQIEMKVIQARPTSDAKHQA